MLKESGGLRAHVAGVRLKEAIDVERIDRCVPQCVCLAAELALDAAQTGATGASHNADDRLDDETGLLHGATDVDNTATARHSVFDEHNLVAGRKGAGDAVGRLQAVVALGGRSDCCQSQRFARYVRSDRCKRHSAVRHAGNQRRLALVADVVGELRVHNADVAAARCVELTNVVVEMTFDARLERNRCLCASHPGAVSAPPRARTRGTR